MSVHSLLDHFSTLNDPRQAWNVVYHLPDFPLVINCGTMAGVEDVVEICRWAAWTTPAAPADSRPAGTCRQAP